MILNYSQFSLNEANRTSKAKALDIMENDLLEQDFIHEIFGKKTFTEGSDYTIDDDKQRGPDGMETSVFIEINDPSEKAMDEVTNNYEAFAAPFVAWAAGNNLYDPEIMTTASTMTFKITL